MEFFDAFLGVGRTNRGIPETPRNEAEALILMERYDVTDALVFHHVARDSDPEMGNRKLEEVTSQRLRKVWGIDPAFVIEESPENFIRRALNNHAKALMVNPLNKGIRLSRSPRLLRIAEILERRKIPLLAVHGDPHGGEDVADWYELADFCKLFPNLPVLVWEFRCRANRPMFDAMAVAENLILSASMLWQNQMIPQIVKSFGAGRLVFSMGLPGLDPGSLQMPLIYSDMSEEDKQAVAHKNILKMLEVADYE